jgi:MFS family permease
MLEYLPSTTRASIIIIIELFWSLGGIFEYLMAMFIVPTYGWRVLTILSALPITIVATCMYVSIQHFCRRKTTRDSLVCFLFSLYQNHLDIMWQVVDKNMLNIY